MKPASEFRKINWSPADRARHRAVRDMFRDWHPSMEELLATGDWEGPVRHGAYLDWRLAMSSLKQERERKGLSLGEVAKRMGVDKAAVSRLESGKQPNPSLFTILQYLDALGKRLAWTFEDVPAKERKPPKAPKNARPRKKTMG